MSTSKDIFVFTDKGIFVEDEVNLILKFSSEETTFNQIKLENLSQHKRSHSIIQSIYIVPPFNLPKVIDNQTTINLIEQNINAIYYEWSGFGDTFQNTGYAALSDL